MAVVWQQQSIQQRITPNCDTYSQLNNDSLTVHSKTTNARQTKALIGYNNSDGKITIASRVRGKYLQGKLNLDDFHNPKRNSENDVVRMCSEPQKDELV